MQRIFLIILQITAAIALCGCQANKAQQTSDTPTTPLVWPAPPEIARLSYERSVGRPRDVGARISAFGRMANWLTGASKGNEPLVRPFGLSLDEEDNLCLTDTAAHTVCFFDRAKKKWFRWDKIGKLRMLSPVAVAKRAETLYVADSGRAAVVAFNLSGKLRFQITNHLARPSGLAIAGQKLYVADAQLHRVFVYDLDGHELSSFGRRGTGPGEFNFPTHLAADSQGWLYVTDSMNCRVQIFTADGEFKGQIGSMGDSPGHFSRPKGVAVDALGHAYVVDANFDNIQIFDRDGRLLLGLGGAGQEPGQFWLPNGIAISRQNEIFVADCYNHRVQVFKYIGPS
jgi:DNA-binding beta-propeller fold protein YncE